MPEAYFNVAIKRRTYLFAIDEDLMQKGSEIAKSREVPAEKLIDAWGKERLLNAA